MRRPALLAAFALTLACSSAGSPPEAAKAERTSEPTPTPAPLRETKLGGFATPESVLWDPQADLYLVSNIAGEPTGVDDEGFISRVRPDGTIESLRWIDGKRDDVELSAPKGSCLSGALLLVTDITHVRRFDRKSGAAAGSIAIAGAAFLNDLACDAEGRAWVSDMATGTIHRLDDVSADAVAVELAAPGVNGLALDGEGRLWAVAEGELFRVEAGARVDVQKLPSGGLDGIVVRPSGSILVSSWDAHAIFETTPGGEPRYLYEGLESPADIGYDAERKRVLIPLFLKNEVLARELP
jgi:sugar lactone lactonase YvrE